MSNFRNKLGNLFSGPLLVGAFGFLLSVMFMFFANVAFSIAFALASISGMHDKFSIVLSGPMIEECIRLLLLSFWISQRFGNTRHSSVPLNALTGVLLFSAGWITAELLFKLFVLGHNMSAPGYFGTFWGSAIAGSLKVPIMHTAMTMLSASLLFRGVGNFKIVLACGILHSLHNLLAVIGVGYGYKAGVIMSDILTLGLLFGTCVLAMKATALVKPNDPAFPPSRD